MPCRFTPYVTASILAAVTVGCATPCEDDGLLQDADDAAACAAMSDTEGETGGPSETETESDPSDPTQATDGDGCANGVQDGDETDVDCGGSCMSGCGEGGGCVGDDDCTSGSCDPDTNTCDDGGDSGGTCDDGEQNGDETDVDCGGACGPTCEIGEGCDDEADCESMACDAEAEVCIDPNCDNGMQDGDETDVDCGGACGPTCTTGEMCEENGDCISDDCGDGMTCEPPDGCNNGKQDGDETDVDCGGECGATCEVGETCEDELDCVTLMCGADNTCEPNPQWCEDADEDGFGDPDACVNVPEGEDPPDGSVNNDGDCDDSSEFTFPGAAPNDDATACMEDKDGDDWGDDDPAGDDTVAGSDCDDVDIGTFPGAAEHELPADACMKDDDDDGWGDDTPPDGVTPGSDCDEDGASPCALLVTQAGDNSETYDQGLSDVLDGLGYDISYVADTDAELADANGFTLLVISETALSTDILGTFRDAIVPAICLEGLVWDDMGMSDEANTLPDDNMTVVAVASPLAGGLTGDVDVVSGNGSGIFVTSPPAGAIEVTSAVGDEDAVAEFAFDAGDTMLDGFVAPRRRVGLGFDADQAAGGATILDDGQTLFEAAVVWVTG